LPCPLAGPSYLVTASEVATLQFTREVLDIPIPRVLTWNGAERNSVNRVGADYIIMEEVAGVHLGFRCLIFPNSDEVKPILDGLLDVEPSSSVSASPTLAPSTSKKTLAKNFNQSLPLLFRRKMMLTFTVLGEVSYRAHN
jgi:hypothetical protein